MQIEEFEIVYDEGVRKVVSGGALYDIDEFVGHMEDFLHSAATGEYQIIYLSEDDDE